MSEPKSLVKNAADPEQVEKARKKETYSRDAELNDINTLKDSPGLRRFMWRILEYCKVNGSVWEASARIHYNAGQQDVGHFIMAEIAEADEEIFFQMMRENKGALKNV